MTDENEKYSLIVLSSIDPEKELPAAIYLKIDGKYVKFKSAGDTITSEKFDLFVSKGVKSIYVESEHIMDFLDWINDCKERVEEAFLDGAGEENRGFFKRSESIKEKMYECFFEEELDFEVVSKIQDNVAEFVEEISKNPITAHAIQALLEKNSTVADHSVNVANLAIYLAMSLGHGHQFVLENIYMGSIFHDYGKVKIPAHILENTGNQMYSQAINDHPTTTVKMLRKTKGIPEQVITIILEHHEQFNGHGYPKGVGGDELYDLGQIVSIANIFENTLTENKHLPTPEKNKKAIKIIQYGRGKQWSPKFYPRVIEALELAFGKK